MPFELDSGQHPWMGLEPTWSSTIEAMDDFTQQMSQMQEEVKAALEHAVDKMAQYYDHWRSPAPVYEVGAMDECPELYNHSSNKEARS